MTSRVSVVCACGRNYERVPRADNADPMCRSCHARAANAVHMANVHRGRRKEQPTPRVCPVGGAHRMWYATPEGGVVTGDCRACGFAETIPNWTPAYDQLTTLREDDWWQRLWGALQQRQGVW